MKTLLTFTALLIFTSASAQIDTTDLIGHWKYQNVTMNNETVEDGPEIEEFTLQINKNGSFKLNTERQVVKGTWKVEQQSLMLTGAPEDSDNIKTETLNIHVLSGSNLAINFSGELPEGLLMHLKKIE